MSDTAAQLTLVSSSKTPRSPIDSRMASFYLDEGVAVETGQILVVQGHDVRAARQIHPAGTSDHIHLATAVRLRRILVTYNRSDFRLLNRAWRDWPAEWASYDRPERVGVLSIPQPPHISAVRAAQLLDDLVSDRNVSGALPGRFLVWSSGRGWHEET